MVLNPPMRYTNAAPSPKKKPMISSASKPSTPRSPAARVSHVEKWPVTVNPSPRSMDAEGSIAHCVLRLDGMPIRAICADKSSIYLAEASNRAKENHGGLSGRLSVRDPRTGKVKNMINGCGNNISCLLVTSNEGHVWSGAFDGMIRVARKGGQALHEARAHASSVYALAEGVEALFSVGGDFLVRAWSSGLVPLRTLRAHTSAVRCVAAPLAPPDTHGYSGEAFAHGGAGIWSGGDDGKIHVWSASEAAGFEHVGCVEDFHGSMIRVVEAQNGRVPRVWIADAAGLLKVYDARTRSLLRTAVTLESGSPPTTCVASTAAAVWVGDASGGVTVYDGASLARLRRLEGAHHGAVGGLAAPRLALSPPSAGGDTTAAAAAAAAAASHDASTTTAASATSPPPKKGEAIVWSFGADSSVRGWGMSERLHDRLSRTRETIEAQYQTVTMMRTMLPRATAAAVGRLEAVAQRSAILTRQLLDLEVSVSVGGEIGELHLTGGVGMPHPDPAAYAARCLSLPTSSSAISTAAAAASAAIELEGNGAPPQQPYYYKDERRAKEYQASVEGLNSAQREISHEVEEALMSLRGRIDELLSFAQGQSQLPNDRFPQATPWQAPPQAPPQYAPPSAPPPAYYPYSAPPPVPPAAPSPGAYTPMWAVPSPRGPK